jgi:hypothetical protein
LEHWLESSGTWQTCLPLMCNTENGYNWRFVIGGARRGCQKFFSGISFSRFELRFPALLVTTNREIWFQKLINHIQLIKFETFKFSPRARQPDLFALSRALEVIPISFIEESSRYRYAAPDLANISDCPSKDGVVDTGEATSEERIRKTEKKLIWGDLERGVKKASLMVTVRSP